MKRFYGKVGKALSLFLFIIHYHTAAYGGGKRHEKLMRKSLSLLFISIALFAGARQINSNEAAAIAKEFLNSSTGVTKAEASVNVRRVQAKDASQNEADHQPYYIFNAADNKGFVIIAGDDRAKKILGYSATGTFDPDNTPPQLAAMLIQYSDMINGICANHSKDSSWDNIESDIDNEVALPTALWDQGYPYNVQCPTVDGFNTPTGCVATALAIVMEYNQWPPKGHGTGSYEINGEVFNYDLNHTYEWSLIHKEDYSSATYSEEEIKAISTLMYDCGRASEVWYRPGGSGASDYASCRSLVNHFDYNSSLLNLSLTSCPVDYFFSKIKTEIDDNRPVFAGSTHLPLDGVFAHQYVIDGYNSDDYLHFNWGWGGYCNGFFCINPYDYADRGLDIFITYAITPKNLTAPKFMFGEGEMYPIDGNFFYKPIGEELHATYRITSADNYKSNSITFGYIVIEKSSLAETFFAKYSGDPHDDFYGGCYSLPHRFKFTEKLPDGEYYIVPAYKINENAPEKCMTSPFYQNAVKLIVTNGKNKFENLSPEESPTVSGIVTVGNAFYILDEEKREATLTYRNKNGNNYIGDVTIPSEITVDNKTYNVTNVGARAFEGCDMLENITLPSSIQHIEYGAFQSSSFRSLNLHELNKLEEITDNLFSMSWPDTNVEPLFLPPNLKRIGNYAFMSVYSTLMELPESVNYIGDYAFSSYSIDAIKFTRKDISDCEFGPTSIITDYFYNPYSQPIIFIPEECKEQYMNLETIKKAEIVKTYKDEIIPVNNIRLFLDGKEIFQGDTICTLPSSITNPSTILNFKVEVYPENATAKDLGWYRHIDSEDVGFNPCYTPSYEDGEYIYYTRGDGFTGLYEGMVKARDGSNTKLKFYINSVPDPSEIPVGLSVVEGDNEDYVTVYDLMGRRLFSGSCSTIPSLKKGVYLMRQGSATKKIIVD